MSPMDRNTIDSTNEKYGIAALSFDRFLLLLSNSGASRKRSGGSDIGAAARILRNSRIPSRKRAQRRKITIGAANGDDNRAFPNGEAYLRERERTACQGISALLSGERIMRVRPIGLIGRLERKKDVFRANDVTSRRSSCLCRSGNISLLT